MASHTSLDDINPQKDLVGKAHIAGESLHTDGAATQNLPPGFDEFAVTPRMKQEGKIADHEALRWVRNSAMWEEHEKNDRIGQFQDTHEARLVVRKDGKAFTRGDLVLMAYPQQIKAAEEARELAEATEWQREIEENRHPENLPRDQEGLRAMKSRSQRTNEQQGYVGPQSPTSGMSLEDAYRRYTAESISAEEDRYRRGPRGVDREAAASRMEQMAARGEARQARQRAPQFAMGDAGFGRNPNSPLAKAQARERGGK